MLATVSGLIRLAPTPAGAAYTGRPSSANTTPHRLHACCAQKTTLLAPVGPLYTHTSGASAAAVVGVARCPHSIGSSRAGHSRGGLDVRVHVFDKIKGMLSGNSAGWAGPPEGQSADGQYIADDADDGAEMVRIDGETQGGLGGTSEEVLGPLAVLLVGFMPHEVDSFRSMMNDMDADIVKLIPCTKAMLGGTLLQAMETEFPQYEQPPLGQRRALFFSGMYGSEVTEVIAAYRDDGLPPSVFAALVPNNAGRTVSELLDAVWRDHAAMMAKLQQREGAADSY